MSDKQYRISFAGRVIEGYDPARVKKHFETIFRFDKKTIARLFSGQTVVLKKRADYQTALKFQNNFKKAGAVCVVREIRPGETGGKTTARGGRSRDGKRGPVHGVVCPRCGFEQGPSEECARCGIIFKKFRDEPEGAPPPPPGAAGGAAPPHVGMDAVKIKNYITIAAGVCFVVLMASFFMKDRLPDPDPSIRKLYKFPVQTETEKDPFFINAGDVRYTIAPLFDYELHGMVVTYYDSTGWWDVSHKFLWRDFLNIKDICVVYGHNAQSGVYQDMSFKSGSWTCYSKPDGELRTFFSPACLSNNHLLAAEKDIKKEIMRAERGDVIRLKGFLAKYHHKNGSRGSSTTRFDSGGSACETVFVEEFEILKKSNRAWRVLFTVSTWLAAGCLVAMIGVYIKEMRSPSAGDETVGVPAPGYGAAPIVKPGRRAGNEQKMKIILQILVLLALLYMWARVH
ncbi:MAG: hypothetical protein GY859_20970 [Desulfobacterales bacterium]|nr:hypothetical protein [Desulfobacterales bacterium]